MHTAAVLVLLCSLAGTQDDASHRRLIRDLGHETPVRREAAEWALARDLEVTAPWLRRAATDEDPERAGRAAKLLHRLEFIRAPKLAFTYGGRTVYDIAVMRLDDERLRIITDGRTFCSSPSWSPDGRRLAYAGRLGDNDWRRTGIWIHDFATGSRSRLSADEGSIHPRWSPDGNRILHERYDGPPDPEFRRQRTLSIWITEVGDGSSRRLLGKTRLVYNPWSPDGRRFLCRDYVDGDYRLLCADSDGKNLRLLADKLDRLHACWAPDGKTVAVSNEKSLFLIDLETGSRRTIRNAKQHHRIASPAFSPDGKTITCGYGIPLGYEPHTWGLDGETVSILKTDPLDAGFVRWTPDGKRAYFIGYDRRRGKFGYFHLHRMGAEGGAPVRLTNDPASAGSLTLFPGHNP